MAISLSPNPNARLEDLGPMTIEERLRYLNPGMAKLTEGFKKFLHDTPKPYTEVRFVHDLQKPHLSKRIQKEEKQNCGSFLFYLAAVPLVGIPITLFKETALAKKLKKDPYLCEKKCFLKVQEIFRGAALLRTISTLALAISILAMAILTGVCSAGLGFGLMGGALAVGGSFTGLYAGLLNVSHGKLKSLGF